MEPFEIIPLSETSIQQVFEITSEATIAKRPEQPLTGLERILVNCNNKIASFALLGFFAMLIAAALHYYFPSNKIIIYVSLFLAILVILLGILTQILVIVSGVPLLLKIRKTPFSPFLSAVQNSCAFDLHYVNRLARCDKRAIQYVLTHYKNERAGFEKRGALLSGSIEKIGLFPAFGALAVLAVNLSHITYASAWLNMLTPIILAFYFLNLAIFGMTQKQDRVIALLEYSIQTHR